jgi:hypothetical protein
MRAKPYRNNRIIRVIRDLYFNGGKASFAHSFTYLFSNAELDKEVPVPMVALVATAVRFTCVCARVLTQNI